MVPNIYSNLCYSLAVPWRAAPLRLRQDYLTGLALAWWGADRTRCADHELTPKKNGCPVQGESGLFAPDTTGS